MKTSKQRFSVIAGANDGCASDIPFILRRDVALALIVVAVLLLGAAVETLSPQPGAALTPPGGIAMAKAESESSQPSEDFVYFPSQYVNQGIEILDPISQF